MSDETPPDWYDESKVTKAIFAFEGGRSAYTGWVVDLGDGTCRFSNSPLLGENGPEWGDRVDLFYHPCSPFDMPMVGYRIYGEGEEPVGRSFGLKREPDEEETARYKEEEEQREKAIIASMNERHQGMMALMKLTRAHIAYAKLLAWLSENVEEWPTEVLDEFKKAFDEDEEEEEEDEPGE